MQLFMPKFLAVAIYTSFAAQCFDCDVIIRILVLKRKIFPRPKALASPDVML
jgi:hypothetical protein